jgi:hypothetical protein
MLRSPRLPAATFDLPPSHLLRALSSVAEVQDLAEAYLAAGIVGSRWRADCIHVAAATIYRADSIVSWNFWPIVRLDKIRAFNAVNLAQGYGMVTILIPKKVNLDE